MLLVLAFGFVHRLESAILSFGIEMFPELTVVIKGTVKPLVIRHRSYHKAESYDWTIAGSRESIPARPW